MYEGWRVVAVVPAGRQQRMAILMDNLRRFRSVLDEVQVWLNCDDDQVADVAWLRSLPDLYPGWVNLHELDPGERVRPKQLNTGRFYRWTRDPETIYVRFDDDIVFVHDDYFTHLLHFRLANPDHLIVFGSIINNAVCSWLLQERELLGTEFGKVVAPYCMDPVGWGSGDFATNLHRWFLDLAEQGQVERIFYPRAEIGWTRFSVSNMCFMGADCDRWGGITPNRDEEIFLTEELPRSWDRKNVVCGSAVVSHYSFFTQHAALAETDILARYSALAQRTLSRDYYRLLGEATAT